MPKVLIIGYGNPLRGDDGVGWVIAEKLRELLPQEIVAVKTGIQLTPELAADLSEAAIAVLVDARAGEPAGEIHCEQVEPLPTLPSSSHHFTPAALLSYALHFFGKAPQTFLVSINGAEFGFQEQLSPIVLNSVPKAVKVILEILRQLGVA
ncbi:MAG: hydrogenase maturation protease [Armatimonadetes bacterium]|nr:hydrogenase maturation protease [Armatimonadota bacterium]